MENLHESTRVYTSLHESTRVYTSHLLILLILLLAPLCADAQYYEVPTDQILQNANLVVHGEVIASTSIMQDEIIYTENILKIDQVLTGDNKVNEVIILTRGGTMDGVTQFQSHGFSLRKGDKGFFFLKEKKSSWGESYYEVYAGQQGFYQRRHDGFMTSLYSQMKSYPSLNSFYKYFGFEYNEVDFEEEMRAVNNPNACLRYRLEPIEATDISTSNEISFNMYVRSTEPVNLRELSIQLNYSNNWFGQNIVANNKLNLGDGDFDESYTLQSSDISEDILEVSLRSNSPVGQLQLLSGSEIKLATVSISFDESAPELPIMVENTIYRSLYYDEDGNLVRNSCGHIEISEEGCGPIITGIDIRKAAGDQSILTITGAGFIHPSAQPNDEWCGLPNIEHRVKFKSVNGAFSQSQLTISPLERDYISWTNNEIQVKIPTQGYVNDTFDRADERKDEIAGTGEVTVCIDDMLMEKCVCFDTSGFNDNPNDGELYVPFSTYTRDNTTDSDFTPNSCLFSGQARLVTRLSSQEVLFDLSGLLPFQRSAFLRALNTWRCATNINFGEASPGLTGSVPVTFGDNIRDGLLAETFFSAGSCQIDNQKIQETTSIVFRSTNTPWEFGTNLPIGQSVYDFETAALHEIGHAMGLNHTCNEGNIMRPDLLALGKACRALSSDDLEGGLYCQNRSTDPLPPPNPALSCGFSLLTLQNKTILTETAETRLSPFTVYPNPTSDDLEINMSEESESATLMVYSSSGLLKLTQRITNSITTLNFDDFDAGVYLIKLETKTKTYVHKVIKL